MIGYLQGWDSTSLLCGRKQKQNIFWQILEGFSHTESHTVGDSLSLGVFKFGQKLLRFFQVDPCLRSMLFEKMEQVVPI